MSRANRITVAVTPTASAATQPCFGHRLRNAGLQRSENVAQLTVKNATLTGSYALSRQGTNIQITSSVTKALAEREVAVVM
jgi:hypothetical protein